MQNKYKKDNDNTINTIVLLGYFINEYYNYHNHNMMLIEYLFFHKLISSFFLPEVFPYS